MLTSAKPPSAPPTVVLIDHSYLHQIGWAESLAKAIDGVNFILVTDKSPTCKNGSLETINVKDAASTARLGDLQTKYDFSIYRALLAERAYFDYTTFDNSQCYSRVDMDDIEGLISSYATVLDDVIRERADLVLGHLADNAISSLAMNIAAYYRKPCVEPFPYYWWSNGLLFVDRPDQTSTDVDLLYAYYYANPNLVSSDAVAEVFARPRVSHQYSDAVTYSLTNRLKKIFSSRNWYEPFSMKNWIARRLRYIWSEFLIRLAIPVVGDVPDAANYVLFPLHVAPEASLLGSTPEMADQFSLIKDISANLPWSVLLYVKLHPGQKKWSGPDFAFFKRIAALKNVRILNADVPVSRILRDDKCLGVATVNGTVGLEAAIQKKPVFVFGRAIYGIADCFFRPATVDEFREQILAVYRGEFTFDEKALSAILAALSQAVRVGKDQFANETTTRAAVEKTFSIIERYIHSRIWQLEGPRRLETLLRNEIRGASTT